MDFIKKYWDNVAGPSWSDKYMMELEYKEVSKYITPDDSVLDVGCGDGVLLSRLDARRRVGIDFSEPMIGKARENNDMNFFVGDARAIDFDDDSFDIVYTVRCLINLPNWEEQCQAINECLRVAKKRVIFSEAFYEPLQRLNAIRQIAGLDLLVEHDFNRYIKEDKLRMLLKDYNFTISNFSSVYYLGTRFVREIICDYKSYTNPINAMFFNLSNELQGGDFGIQKMCIIEL